MLDVADLTVSYRASGPKGSLFPAVRGVSLRIERGGSLGLAGESGCGKSTLANAILRLLPSDAVTTGQVRLNGVNVFEMRPGQLRSVRWTEGAIVFQGALHALNPVQRVGTQIAEPMLLHKTQASAKDAKDRVNELLEQVGLPGDRARAYPHQLSGGQRQRVLIAMALACDPDLLIADEPTTALDVMVQAQVLRLLATLRAERGLSMLFITHDLTVLTDVCDDLAVLYAGKIVERGPSTHVFTAPLHPYTTALSRAFPIIGDASSRMSPAGLGGDPPDPANLPTGCSFHPRCAVATERCSTVDIELIDVGDRREAACILVEPS
ncbi:MAG: ABC transporter ATP-binding protein [Acidimicrobiales bacterium]